jgi:polar amino acid transport system permease protein
VDVFFSGFHFRESFPLVWDGFQTNLVMMFVAEACVLAWGLVIVLLRMAPGRFGLPFRIVSIIYVDLFRGIPLIVLVVLVGFGLPIAGVFPWISLFWWGVIALTLAYGAYVAEVYRSGIRSIHPSQLAAARSLGLSHTKTMRFVVLPQAVRNVVPALMNDFVSLQKDTALVSVIGLAEGLQNANVYAGNNLNYTSVVGVALCFIAITIPMTRLVDWLLERDDRRRQAGFA